MSATAGIADSSAARGSSEIQPTGKCEQCIAGVGIKHLQYTLCAWSVPPPTESSAVTSAVAKDTTTLSTTIGVTTVIELIEVAPVVAVTTVTMATTVTKITTVTGIVGLFAFNVVGHH
mmetsp:Transcript_83675/g.161526  ORF Transcript_83675/g.161526 Transcript_83675/m.161526 type:complete len:118 (+) Transcript_83675:130-483(+)